MATALALAVYAVFLAIAGTLVWRRPIAALFLFVVGLALHNAAMAALYGLGLRGAGLTLVAAWKEILLGVAAARVSTDAFRARRLPFRPGSVDALALGFGALVLLYAVIPQDVLDGRAGAHAQFLALRHDLVPVVAYFVGRALAPKADELRALAWTVVAAAAAVAAVGLVEVYAVPIDWWRDSSVPAYFRDQLGYDYRGTGGLPENFVYNTGSEESFLRRLVSVFLSPLGAAFMFVVALLVAAAGGPLVRRRGLLLGLSAVSAAGLLFTFSRSSLLVLAGGLCVLAVARRRLWLVAAAAATLVAAFAFAEAYPSIGPRGEWTAADLALQRAQAAREGGVEGGPLSPAEPSIQSHLDSLREGLRTVVEHPYGYGLGNAGTIASREDVPIRAGESNYTELGVETGVIGMALFAAWSLVLLGGLVLTARRADDSTLRWAAAAVAASLAAVLALAVQTDTFGVPWLAYCVWWLGGSLVTARTQVETERSRATTAPPPRPLTEPSAEV